MKRLEILRIAGRRFVSHPLQMWLTVAGLVVGTASVICMVTLGLTGRGFVQDQIEGVGSHLVWTSYEGTVTSGAGAVRRPEDAVDEADFRAIGGRRDLFTGVTGLVELRAQTTVLGQPAAITVLGTFPNYGSVRKNLRIVRGRFLDDDDLGTRAKVCVVSRKLYEELFGTEEPAGKAVRVLGMGFSVVGEFEEPVDTLGQGDVRPRTLFIPATVAWFFTPKHKLDTIFAQVRDFDAIPFAAEQVRQMLVERHRLGAHYRVDSMTSVIRVANAISIGLLGIFTLVAAISVLVGGMGIMNIMLASVEQRVREIGIRKSVGARRRDILLEFLAETLLLGVVGSALGVAVGFVPPLVARALVDEIVIRVSPLSGVLAFAFSCLVTLLFGLAPAWHAASLDPIQCLRHE